MSVSPEKVPRQRGLVIVNKAERLINDLAPHIDNIAAQRGITREDLAGRILAKAEAYALDAGAAFGRRQALEDQLEAIKAQLQAGEIDEDQARAAVAALAYPGA